MGKLASAAISRWHWCHVEGSLGFAFLQAGLWTCERTSTRSLPLFDTVLITKVRMDAFLSDKSFGLDRERVLDAVYSVLNLGTHGYRWGGVSVSSFGLSTLTFDYRMRTRFPPTD